MAEAEAEALRAATGSAALLAPPRRPTADAATLTDAGGGPPGQPLGVAGPPPPAPGSDSRRQQRGAACDSSGPQRYGDAQDSPATPARHRGIGTGDPRSSGQHDQVQMRFVAPPAANVKASFVCSSASVCFDDGNPVNIVPSVRSSKILLCHETVDVRARMQLAFLSSSTSGITAEETLAHAFPRPATLHLASHSDGTNFGAKTRQAKRRPCWAV